MRLLVIADDLTGAADSAARCAAAGLPALLQMTAPSTLPDGIIALSSDSRHLPPAQAGRQVGALVDALRQRLPSGETVWYKKIDSTLRGNLGAELDAVLDRLASPERAPCALICPAFPAQQRGLEEGYLVHAQTPARTLHLPSLLREQSVRPVAHLSLALVRGSATALQAAVRTALDAGAHLLVGDALTDGDLDALLAVMHAAAPHALLCGSAGLVGRLAAGLAKSSVVTAPPDAGDPSPRAVRRVLLVVGSGSPMAHRQIHVVRARSDVKTQLVTPAATDVPSVDLHAPSHGPAHLLLHLPMPRPETPLDGPQARQLATRLADDAVATLGTFPADALILVGGDTAVHVLDRLQVTRLAVLRELLPGMPLTRPLDGRAADGRPLVVLKAGNHGDDQTLASLLDQLHTDR